MLVLFALLLADARYDAKFCPLAPSPELYQQTGNYLKVLPGGKYDVSGSFQVASRLVDKRSNEVVGWLYLDEHGLASVTLVPHVDPAIYAAFGMVGHNQHRPDYPTEAILQRTLRIPKGIEVQSCTLPRSSA